MAASNSAQTEIERLAHDVQTLEQQLSAAHMSQRSRLHFRPGHSLSPCEQPPVLNPFEFVTSCDPPAEKLQPEPLKTKRKEIEARRYSGKESISEYLLQFELTARRNGWSDPEKAVNLLCALDGPARNLLAEVDIDTVSYPTVKDLLTKRFGPVNLPEVHEQALQELKLGRHQPIREMTTEVTRLAKLAYPEFDENARERFAVKALINSIPDQDTVFYIKEKNPRNLDDVCFLYERYKVLTGHPVSSRPTAVKSVKPSEPPQHAEEPPKNQMVESMAKQLAHLTECVNKLLLNQQRSAAPAQAPAPHTNFPPPNFGYTPDFQGPRPLLSHGNFGDPPRQEAPRKPCPRCKQHGHWLRDCTQPEVCYKCRQPGHRRDECPAHLNGNGPTSAPHAGPQITPPY